ncbi:MAG TPA: hypothetical protein EYN96_02725 [Candidatus Hydrogenedentes bacterium]|nr:hypothetical protein [Candidatus Hydrogenedentota bacterium]
MYKKVLVTTVLVAFLCTLASAPAAEPVKIIFDSDMALDCEDMNALCLLHALVDKGEAEILATVASGYETNRASGAAIDAINTFYGRPDIPVGTTRVDMVFSKEAIPVAKSPWTPAVRDKYPHDVGDDDRCEAAVRVYRRILDKQPDNSVTIVTTGWLVNLRDLLRSKPDGLSKLSGEELVRKKVKEVSIMGGAFPMGWEYNFGFGGAHRSTKFVLDNWPENVPLVMSGVEIGLKIISGKVYKDELPESPLRTGLENAWNALSAGRPSWDETSVLYAVRGASFQGEEYWKLVTDGSVAIDDSTGVNTWVRVPDRNQAYLIQSMDPKAMGKLLEELVLESTRNAVERADTH